MSRSTARQHFESNLPRRRKKPTIAEVARLMGIRVKQSLRQRGLVPVQAKKEWRWEYTGTGKSYAGTVYAHTRSEARSEVKKRLGIKKGRLPSNVTIHAPITMIRQSTRAIEPASAGAA